MSETQITALAIKELQERLAGIEKDISIIKGKK